MEKNALVTVMLIATIIVSLMPFVPHHHHDGVWCNVVERCDIDNAENDAHTSHHGDRTLCVEETDLIASRPSHAGYAFNTQYLYPLLLLTAIVGSLPEHPVGSGVNYACVSVIRLYDAWIADSSGLRAPPFPMA